MTTNPPKRLRRDAIPKAVVTHRDLVILASIAWAGLLTTSQVARLHFRTRRRAQRRLRALLDAGLVRAHMQGEALQRDNVYTLSRAGHDRLSDLGALDGRAVAIARLPRPQKLAHAIAIRDVFVAANLAERASAFELLDFRFDSDLARDPGFRAAGIVPDGLCVLRVGSDVWRVGVEVDLASELLRTVREKLAVWVRFFATAERSAPTSLLVAVSNGTRLARLETMVAEAGLTFRARAVMLADVAAVFASGWPRDPATRPRHSERRTETDERAFVPLGYESGEAPFRPIR